MRVGPFANVLRRRVLGANVYPTAFRFGLRLIRNAGHLEFPVDTQGTPQLTWEEEEEEEEEEDLSEPPFSLVLRWMFSHCWTAWPGSEPLANTPPNPSLRLLERTRSRTKGE